MRFILIFLFFVSFSCAYQVESMEYVFDKDNKPLINYKDYKEFKKLEKFNFGIQKNPIVTRYKINSTKDDFEHMVFYNPRPTIAIVDIIILENNKLLKKLNLGEFRTNEQKGYINRYAYFELLLKPQHEYIIITKLSDTSIVSVDWKIKSSDDFLLDNVIETMIVSVYIGLILLLIYQNILNYLSTKNNIFNIYSLYIAFMFVTQLFHHGYGQFLSDILSARILAETPWIITALTVISATWFTMKFFKIKENSKTIFKYNIFVIAFNSLLFFILLFGLIFNQDLYIYVMKDINIYYIFAFDLSMLMVLLGLNVYSGYKNSIVGTTYVMLGFIFLIAIILFYTIIDGIAPMNNGYNMYSRLIAALIEFIFISYALSLQIRNTYEKQRQNEKLLQEYSKHSQVVKAIANISHQFRTPIINLGSIITNLEATSMISKDKLLSTIDDSLKKAKDILFFMDNSMSNFLGYYKINENHENIHIKQEIENIKNLINYQINKNNISVTIEELEENIHLKISKNNFYNCFFVLFENSIKEFEKQEKQNNRIDIKVYIENNKKIIQFCDNAGGMDNQKIKNLFNQNKRKDLGMGLILLHDIITNKSNSTLEISNYKDGLMVKMSFDIV
jgi:signal transduction histidine kinase